MKRVVVTICLISIALLFLFSSLHAKSELLLFSNTTYMPNNSTVDTIEEIRRNINEDIELHDAYKELTVIDVHNHDAWAPQYVYWNEYNIDKVVLFGNVSEPSARKSDALTWRYYKNNTDKVYPSFAGFPLSGDDNGLEVVKEKLEQGYMHIGELIAASTYSPSRNVKWKAQHPYWGIFPEVYDLAAKYKVPIMLHIDPPKGNPIAFLERALANHPETIIVFAHGNVYNSPKRLGMLLKKYDNLYIDFFAGFTRYNKTSDHELEDFVSLIETYSDHFFLGSDSGVEIGYENSLSAMYELIHLLSPETAVKVAYQNFEKLIEEQPPTNYQVEKIKELTHKLKETTKRYDLNKRKANELIFQLEKKLK